MFKAAAVTFHQYDALTPQTAQLPDAPSDQTDHETPKPSEPHVAVNESQLAIQAHSYDNFVPSQDIQQPPAGDDEQKKASASATSTAPPLSQSAQSVASVASVASASSSSASRLDNSEFRTIPYNDMAVGKQIGEGSFGIVYLATWHGTYVALKKLKLQDFGPAQMEAFRRELHIMSRVPYHPNVLTLIGGCVEPPNLCLVSDYIPKGSVEHVLISRADSELNNAKTQQDMIVITRMALDASAGLLHLHSAGIVHRDVAARNLLVDDSYRVKVCDFGLSRLMSEASAPGEQDRAGNQYARTSQTIGPIKWEAPECLEAENRSKKYSFKSDVWMFGITLYEMFVREEPYPGMSPFKVATEVLRGYRMTIPTVNKLGQHIPTGVINLMYQCWTSDPALRPDMKTVNAKLWEVYENMNPNIEQIADPEDLAMARAVAARQASEFEAEEEDSIIEPIDNDPMSAAFNAITPAERDLLPLHVTGKRLRLRAATMARWVEWVTAGLHIPFVVPAKEPVTEVKSPAAESRWSWETPSDKIPAKPAETPMQQVLFALTEEAKKSRMALLYNHPLFTTPSGLLAAIEQRFSVEPTAATPEVRRMVLPIVNRVKAQVLLLLEEWLRTLPQDFSSSAVQAQADAFLTRVIATSSDSRLTELSKAIQSALHSRTPEQSATLYRQPTILNPSPSQLPKPILPKVFAKENLDALELARQITLIHFEGFAKIHPRELLNQRFAGANRREVSPNLFDFIQQFNEMISWIALEILSGKDLKGRVVVMTKFIDVAQHCREMNNFHAVLGIVSALTLSSIFRLRKTWAALSSKTLKKWDLLRDATSTSSNYATIRRLLLSVEPPCIPVVSLLMSDLVFIDESNPNRLTLDDGRQLENVVKYSRATERMNAALRFQQYPYYFEPIQGVQAYIKASLAISDESVLYKMSLEAEPKAVNK